MGFNKSTGKVIATYSAVLGLIYLTFGLVEILAGLGFVEVPLVPADVFGGIMLVIIAAVFLAGISEQWKGNREGLSFFVVGILLAAIFFGLYVLIMVANGLGYLLQFEDWLEWTWLDDLRPGIWLFSLVLPGAYITLKRKEWRR